MYKSKSKYICDDEWIYTSVYYYARGAVKYEQSLSVFSMLQLIVVFRCYLVGDGYYEIGCYCYGFLWLITSVIQTVTIV